MANIAALAERLDEAARTATPIPQLTEALGVDEAYAVQARSITIRHCRAECEQRARDNVQFTDASGNCIGLGRRQALGDATAIVLRGSGAVVTGPTLESACGNAFFLEDAARIELSLLPARAAQLSVLEFSAEEAAARATSAGGIYERMWHFLCFGDDAWRGPA